VRPALFPAGESAEGAPDASRFRAFSGFGMRKAAFAAAPQKVFFGAPTVAGERLDGVRRNRREQHRITSRNKRAAFLKHFFARSKLDALCEGNSYAADEAMPTAAAATRRWKLFLQSC